MDKKKRPELITVLSCLRDSERVNMGINRNGKQFDLYGEAANLKDLDELNGYFVDSIGRAAAQGIEIEASKDIQNNDGPDDVKYNRDPSKVEAEDDDRIRFGDVVGFKTLAGDLSTGIVIYICDDNAAILHKNFYDEHLHVTYCLLENLRRLKITYSELSEDIIDWLAN